VSGLSVLLQGATGLLFGFGLVVSGMSKPEKVLNFLDVAAIFSGTWDPSLAIVMAGAIGVAMPGFALVRRLRRPLLAQTFHLPYRRDVDRRLVAGAGLFGVGWGLVGLCPGPAFTALSSATPQALLFAGAMLLGMATAQRVFPSP
jgi:uncharacterized protein